ncbi:MAG: DMT family transporter [Oscillospiraceae bacterium]|nr:DMT family transporter [Oscillospiraceae bacterium]
MLYLILAFFSSAMVSVGMRFSDAKVKSSFGMLAVNYVVCTALAATECGALGPLPMVPGLGKALGLGVFNGFIYLAGFVLLRYNVSRSGVVLSSTFMKLGLLVTMVISIVFFGEKPEVLQLVGFALAVAAIVLINYQPGAGKSGLRWGLLVLMVTGGLCDGMSKVYEEVGTAALSGQFLFYTFFTAMVLCFALAAAKKQLPGVWEWLFGICIGVPNYYSCSLLLWSLRTVPGVIAYPVYSVAGILIVTLCGVLLFREKLSRRQWTALGIIVLALVLLNI